MAARKKMLLGVAASVVVVAAAGGAVWAVTCPCERHCHVEVEVAELTA